MSEDESLILLRSGTTGVAIDRTTGALSKLDVLDGAWAVQGRHGLGESFRILLPRPDRRHNEVLGEHQKLTGIDVANDGRSVSLSWGPLRSEDGVDHDIRLVGEVRVDEGGVVFTMSVDNRSELTVETMMWPYLADVQPQATEAQLTAFCYSYATAKRRQLWPTFENVYGYYGVDRPTMMNEPSMSVSNPTAPFILLDGAGMGLYVGVDEDVTDLVAWYADLDPGYGESITASVPMTDVIGDRTVAIRFAAAHVPYIQPGEKRDLAPIRVQGYRGDWHNGVDVYTDRRRAWETLAAPPAWAGRVHSWQQVQLNSPEDERRYRFDDLPAIAQECVERGVTAIQVVGWNEGGQDQNNPSHTADPKLGGVEELKKAVAACQALGVKVILFTKFIWADRATDRFRQELIHSAIKDPYGDYYLYPGYRYQTVTQLLDINTKRLIPMCFADEKYLKVCDEEFSKVLETGADGMLFDECLHHSPALACFDENHGHRYGDPVYGHDVDFAQRLRVAADASNPDFLFAGEACYDREFIGYQLSYHRSENVNHLPLSRYLRPDALLMTAVTGFDDRNMVNQCLLYRYIISYEPYNFKGRLTDIPLTVGYGQRMDAAREELREWFWEGTFQDTVGARVINSLTGAAHHPYAVYRHAENESLGIVVANYEVDRDVSVEILTVGDDAQAYRLVEDTEWAPIRGPVRIPPRSAAIIVPAGMPAEQDKRS